MKRENSMPINLEDITTQKELDQLITHLRMGVVSYYDVLNIPETADEAIISRAFRQLSLTTHPDKNPSDPLAAKKFKILNEAKDVLLDLGKRKEYDTLLIAQHKNQTPTSSLPSPIKPESRTSTPSATATKTSPNPSSARATPNRSFSKDRDPIKKQTPNKQEQKIETPKQQETYFYTHDEFMKLPYSELESSRLQKRVDDTIILFGDHYKGFIKEILRDWKKVYQKLREPKGVLACMSIFQGARFLENPLKYARENFRTLGCPEKINPQDLNELQTLWILLKYAEAKPMERTAHALRELIRKGYASFNEDSSPYRSQSK